MVVRLRLGLVVPTILFLIGFLVVPVVGAHHGDTPEQAEAPAPGPITLYHHYLQIGMELEELQNAYPDKMTYKVIGHSVLGLEIYGVEVTNFASDEPPLEDRKRLYFDGSIHSNEQLGMEAVMDILRWLLEEYENDELAKFSVDERRTFLVPLVNPDGNVRDSRQNSRMVDLNRNFPAGWGGPGSSARGDAPLSEPETQAVASFLEEVVPHYSNSFHTGTLMLLHPYGNYDQDSGVVSPDHDLYTAICRDIQDAMDAANGGEPVPCGQVYSTIYPASGTTVDYVYDVYGSNSWTFEVDGQQNMPFSDEDIRPRLGETWAAVQHAYENVHRYGALFEITDVAPVVDGDTITGIDVTVHNTGMGASNNTAAWLGSGTSALANVDIPSVAPDENVTFRLDGFEWGVGDEAHLKVVYDQTFYKGFQDTQKAHLEVVAVDGGVALVTSAGEVGHAVDHDAPGISGFEAVLGAAALIGALMVARRRR